MRRASGSAAGGPGAFPRAPHPEEEKTPARWSAEHAVVGRRGHHTVSYTGKMTASLHGAPRNPNHTVRVKRMPSWRVLTACSTSQVLESLGCRHARSLLESIFHTVLLVDRKMSVVDLEDQCRERCCPEPARGMIDGEVPTTGFMPGL